MSLRMFLSRGGAKTAAITGLAVLLCCTTPEPRKEVRKNTGQSKNLIDRMPNEMYDKELLKLIISGFSPLLEEQQRMKERCIELMINDKSWRDSYSFLETALALAREGHIRLKIPAERTTYINEFKNFSPAEQANEREILYRVIQKTNITEKPSSLDLIFISEIQYNMRDYLEHETPPKLPHWLRNIAVYRSMPPASTNNLPAAPK